MVIVVNEPFAGEKNMTLTRIRELVWNELINLERHDIDRA